MTDKKLPAMTMLYKGEDKTTVDANDKDAFDKLVKDGWKDSPPKPKAKKGK